MKKKLMELKKVHVDNSAGKFNKVWKNTRTLLTSHLDTANFYSAIDVWRNPEEGK